MFILFALCKPHIPASHELAALTLCLMTAVHGAWCQPRYTAQQLPNLQNYPRLSAYGINNEGYVVGHAFGDFPQEVAVLWSYGVPSSLGVVSGYDYSAATFINNSGLIAGQSGSSSSEATFLYSGTMKSLGLIGTPPDGALGSNWPSGLNDSGQVLVLMSNWGGPGAPYSSYVYNSSNSTLTGFSIGQNDQETFPTSINNSGAISGFYCDATVSICHPFLYSNATLTVLPDVLMFNVLNNRGDVAGCSGGGAGVAMLLPSNGTLTTIGALPGDVTSGPESINDYGDVVGASVDASYNSRAFVYTGGAIYDLNTLAGLPAGTLSGAYGINNAGQIIARNADQTAAYLLTPLPPASFACPPQPGAPTVNGQVDFGGKMGSSASGVQTCTYPVEVPQGSQFVLLGVRETDTYWTDADPTICTILGCNTAPSFSLTAAGPGGQALPLANDSVATNAPPGAGWTTTQSSITACFSQSGCSAGTVDFHSMGFPDLGQHHLAQAVKESGTLLVDTSSLTKNGPTVVTLTYTMTAINSWEPLDVQVAWSGNNWFTLASTTPTTFRPRDARDGAIAQCDQYPTDCHPSFELYWQAPVAFFGNSPAYAPLPLQANFTLEAPLFRTANPPPGSGPWLTGTSTNSGTDGPTDPDYVFEQSSSSPSINPGFSAPGNGGLAIGTQAGQLTTAFQPIALTVTSHDYGGSANLRASVTLTDSAGAHTFNNLPVADPTQPINTQQPGTWTPPSCAGNNPPFLTIPVDKDCNGIADSWEAPYITEASADSQACQGPTITSFLGSEDIEQGYTCTTPAGDGWSVHDEYRGFHFVADDGVSPKWASTDPVRSFDMFFWDSGFTLTPPYDPILAPLEQTASNIYTISLRQILCLQGDSIAMGYGATFPMVPAFPIPPKVPPTPNGQLAGYRYCSGGINEYDPMVGPGSAPNPLKYLYRRVNAQQAHAFDPGEPLAGVDFFNVNSSTSLNGNHIVIVFYSNSLNKQNSPTQPNTLVLGETFAPKFNNVPGVNNSRVEVDIPAIYTTAASRRPMPAATLAAQVVAHETGHWLGQEHPWRTPVYGEYTPATMTWGASGYYTFLDNPTPSATIYIGLNVLIQTDTGDVLPRSVIQRSENIVYPGVTVAPVPGYGFNPNPFGVPVFQATFPSPRTTNGIGDVEIMQDELMDWTANKNMIFPTQWHFDPANLNNLCAKIPCN